MLLSKYNDMVEKCSKNNMNESPNLNKHKNLPYSFVEWLWPTDSLECYHIDILLNGMPFMGLFIVTYRANKQMKFLRNNLTLIRF